MVWGWLVPQRWLGRSHVGSPLDAAALTDDFFLNGFNGVRVTVGGEVFIFIFWVILGVLRFFFEASKTKKSENRRIDATFFNGIGELEKFC